MEFFYRNNNLVTQSSAKKEIIFNLETKDVSIDDFSVSNQGEYEKSGILVEVKDYENNFFYSISVDGYHVFIITTDSFELTEDILSFFGDIDVLLLPGSKNSIKIYENIEAKVVIPYGEGKDVFFATISQHKDEVENFKVKGEIMGDVTEFVNLKN
nr:hypothetical protein [Candidatus Gracilibacteria bacterium]